MLPSRSTTQSISKSGHICWHAELSFHPQQTFFPEATTFILLFTHLFSQLIWLQGASKQMSTRRADDFELAWYLSSTDVSFISLLCAHAHKHSLNMHANSYRMHWHIQAKETQTEKYNLWKCKDMPAILSVRVRGNTIQCDHRHTVFERLLLCKISLLNSAQTQIDEPHQSARGELHICTNILPVQQKKKGLFKWDDAAEVSFSSESCSSVHKCCNSRFDF